MIPNISSDWALELRIFLRNVYSHVILISYPNFLRKIFYGKNVSWYNSKYGLPCFCLLELHIHSVIWSDTKKSSTYFWFWLLATDWNNVFLTYFDYECSSYSWGTNKICKLLGSTVLSIFDTSWGLDTSLQVIVIMP